MARASSVASLRTGTATRSVASLQAGRAACDIASLRIGTVARGVASLPGSTVIRSIASFQGGMAARGAVSPAIVVVLLAVLPLLLSACGFRLQGRVPLPASLAATWIETEDAQSDFVVDLKRALRASGATLAARREEATAVLRVERDELTESVLSVSGRNLPREVELTYTVRLAVEGQGEDRGQGRTLLPSEEFAVSRDQSFVEEQLLAKEREQEILRAALARDLVGVVMRRLSSLP